MFKIIKFKNQQSINYKVVKKRRKKKGKRKS